MAVDIARRTDVGMPEPFLDHLHRHLFRQQKRGAGVPEFVEADVLHAVFFQKQREMFGDVIGRIQPSRRICTDVLDKIRSIGIADYCS